eukprot:7548164-Lingulodinium_polyedra.AAC.1
MFERIFDVVESGPFVVLAVTPTLTQAFVCIGEQVFSISPRGGGHSVSSQLLNGSRQRPRPRQAGPAHPA